MKVIIIPIVVEILGMVLKGERRMEELGIKRKIEIIQTTTSVSLDRIL